MTQSALSLIHICTARFRKMADSMVAMRMTGSVADLNVSTSTSRMAAMAMRFVTWLSSVTTVRMS